MKVAFLKSWILLIAMAAVLGSAFHAHAVRPSEYQVKAVFLYNFAKFVEWPEAALPDTATTLVISILGEDPFGDAFASIEGKTVKGRELVIKRFAELPDLEPCHILFISSLEKKRLSAILEHIKTSSILLVSEMEDFTQKGGMVNFVLQKKKVRFEISIETSEEAGLKLSSRLLKLALNIKGGQRGAQQ
jgi:hypothetical protein